MADAASLPTYAIVGIIIIGVITILPLGAAVLFIGSWVGRVQTAAVNAEKSAEVARERIHALGNELAIYQQKVATEFVRNEALEKSEARLMRAIGEIGTRIDRLFTPRAGAET